MVRFRFPTLLAASAFAAALTLSGCEALSGFSVPSQTPPSTSDAPKTAAKKTPKAVTMPTADALKGEGIYYFDDRSPSRFYITNAIAKNGLYPVKEEYARGLPHGFTWGGGAATLLRNGKLIDASTPTGVSIAKDHHVEIHFSKDKKEVVTLHLSLEAYDLSGFPIGPYLVTRTNRPTPSGYLINEKYVFPQGSIGYKARLWTKENEVIIPTRSAFTGSGSVEEFSQRFTKDIPFCMGYITKKNAEPIGFRFPATIEKKVVTEGTGKRARQVEAAQSGSFDVYPVKADTLFCQSTSSKPKAKGKWNLRYINGSRVLELDFPNSIASENYGMPAAHRKALKVAFAEVKPASRREKQRLLPARVWVADSPIVDMQWRFNGTAAKAVQGAIDAVKKERAEYDKTHQRPKAK